MNYNWKKLKDCKCPACPNRYLDKDFKRGGYKCGSCDFRIGLEKFDNLVNGLYIPKKVDFVREEVANQEALNNL